MGSPLLARTVHVARPEEDQAIEVLDEPPYVPPLFEADVPLVQPLVIRQGHLVDAQRDEVLHRPSLASRTVIDSERLKAEEGTQYSDSEPGYLRFAGTSNFRKYAKPGDLVLAVWRPNSKSSRAHVFAPEPVLRRKDENGITHLFVEEYADREDTRISWTEFSRLWWRTTASRLSGHKAIREIPVELLERLRAAWPR